MTRAFSLLLVFAACGVLISPDSVSDGGTGQARMGQKWKEIQLPWNEPTAFQIGIVDERVVVFASAYTTDNRSDNTTAVYMARWTEDAGLHDVVTLETFPSITKPRFIWNGALLTEHLETGGGNESNPTLFTYPGNPVPTQVFRTGYTSDYAILAVGGATGLGEAWVLRDPYYRGERTHCPMNTIEFYQRQVDGGLTKQICPFEPNYISEGGEAKFPVTLMHPTRRFAFRKNFGFFEFDEDGKIRRLTHGYNEPFAATEDEPFDFWAVGPQFWPSLDYPPRVVGPKTAWREQFSGQREFLTEAIYEWRWEDGGIEKRSSILTEYTDFIDYESGFTATSRGVVVKAYVKEESLDGGEWKNKQLERWHPRLILMSNDGKRVLNFQDEYAQFIAEDHGKFYAFWVDQIMSPLGFTQRRLLYAPLDL